MTCVDVNFRPGRVNPVTGRIKDHWQGAMRLLASGAGSPEFDAPDAADELGSNLTALERNLRDVQSAISAISMHLPPGFAVGLKSQFANMLDAEEWDPRDQCIDIGAVSCFLVLLITTHAEKRPGIGTDGKGGVAAFWHSGGDRLTVTCLPSGDVTWVMSHAVADGSKERVAGICRANRLMEILAPFDPGRWFDQ